MRNLFPSTLLLSVVLAGCFGSSSVEPICTAVPECPPGTMAAECLGRSDCQEVTLCGQTLTCAATTTCGAIPICPPGEIEDPSCAFRDGDPLCTENAICGSRIWCVPDCDPDAVCAGDIPREEICDDAHPPCYPVEACGRTFYCEEACDVLACPFDMEEVPSCRIGNAGCHVESSCGEYIFCVSTSDHCPGGREVPGPGECDEGSSCYFVDVGERRVWCTGGGDSCFAYPVCSPDEVNMELLDPCLDDRVCRYVSACGNTVQCGSLRADG